MMLYGLKISKIQININDIAVLVIVESSVSFIILSSCIKNALIEKNKEGKQSATI